MYDKITTYEEAVELVKKLGFMPLSKNPFGFVSLGDVTLSQNWHTNEETDPWLWKDRIAFEKHASYSRVIGKRLAFISKEWYPCFLAMYRLPMTVEERYENGAIGNMTLEIYRCLKDNRPLNTHELKKRLGIDRESKSKFENGLTELQGSMDVTVFGAARRMNKQGESYGWLVSEYTTVDQWAEAGMLEAASKIQRQEAVDRIAARVQEIVPSITDKDIWRFLGVKK